MYLFNQRQRRHLAADGPETRQKWWMTGFNLASSAESLFLQRHPKQNEIWSGE